MSEFESKIADYFSKKEDVIAVFLYGSFAKRQQRLDSDIDLAVLCADNSNRRRFYELELEYFRELSRIIRHNVDIVILNRAGELLSYEVFKEGRLIYERNRGKRVDFQARRTVDYLDFAPFMERMSQGMMNKLQERLQDG